MRSSDSVGGVVAGVIGVSLLLTVFSGSFFHWPFVLAGIAAGLMAGKSIR